MIITVNPSPATLSITVTPTDATVTLSTSTAMPTTVTATSTSTTAQRPSLDDEPWEISVYFLTAVLGNFFVLFFFFRCLLYHGDKIITLVLF